MGIFSAVSRITRVITLEEIAQVEALAAHGHTQRDRLFLKDISYQL